jgi:hypothetical protein
MLAHGAIDDSPSLVIGGQRRAFCVERHRVLPDCLSGNRGSGS